MSTDASASGKSQKVLCAVLCALCAASVLLFVIRFVGAEPSSLVKEETTASVQTTAVETTATVTDTTTVPETTVAPNAEISTLRPASSVGDEFFDGALFLGNSIIDDMVLYNKIDNAALFADTGLNVRTFYTSKVIPLEDGSLITAEEAVRLHRGEFKKIYVMFGFNEIGWDYPSIFIEEYGKIIDLLAECNPQAEIYVHSILPVTKVHSDSDPYENAANINKFNALIEPMVVEKGAHYLDVGMVMKDENGYLPDYAAHDGVHFGVKLSRVWLDFLKENT